MSQALIIGSPNSGKSLLFNRLTGLNQKVANFPGITVSVHTGLTVKFSEQVELIDLPGTYSLNPVSEDEKIAVAQFKKAIADPQLKFVLCLIDSTRLERGLYFTSQVIAEAHKHNKPVIVVANMIDTLKYHNLEIDIEGLSKELGVDVYAVSAKTQAGIDQLIENLEKPIQPVKKEKGELFGQLNLEDLKLRARQLTEKYGPKGDLLIRTQNKIDKFLLHSIFGGVAFFAIMYVLFQSIFTWAVPLMDGVEAGIEVIAGFVVPLFNNTLIQDFLSDALFGGIGSFLVFVPQIFVLTFVVGLLEDSGYLARAAIICHKPLKAFGLTGKSFVPMLSGVACAIPGIYAARTIESPIRRWLTYFAIPLMPCSARLPVYALLIAAFIPPTTALGGLVGLQGLAMFLIYFFGIFVGLLVTALLSRTKIMEKSKDLPFVIEMPPYRLPSLMPLIIRSLHRSKLFITKAGGIIFTVTVVVWVLGYFPNMGTDLGASYLGQIGHFLEPLVAPLGLDWRYGVAIITSFLAREVFVGTLGTLFGIEGAEENIAGLAENIQASGLSLGSGIALIAFFAVAMQCVSTLAVLKGETGSWKMPAQIFIGYGLLAYGFAYLAFLIF